jgi:hypothetical protein
LEKLLETCGFFADGPSPIGDRRSSGAHEAKHRQKPAPKALMIKVWRMGRE